MEKTTYHVLDASKGEEYRQLRLEALKSNGNSVVESGSRFLKMTGQGQSDVTIIPVKKLKRLLDNLLSDIKGEGEFEQRKHREFDGRAGILVYESLQGLNAEILADRGFWRYLTVDVFFDIVHWRHPKNNGDRWGTNPSQFNRNMLFSLYIRGQIANQCTPEQCELLSTVNDVDLWTSHVIAVLYGSSATIVYSFIAYCASLMSADGTYDKFARLQIRELAKLLSAARSNFVFDLFDQRESDAVVKSLIPIARAKADKV